MEAREAREHRKVQNLKRRQQYQDILTERKSRLSDIGANHSIVVDFLSFPLIRQAQSAAYKSSLVRVAAHTASIKMR